MERNVHLHCENIFFNFSDDKQITIKHVHIFQESSIRDLTQLSVIDHINGNIKEQFDLVTLRNNLTK